MPAQALLAHLTPLLPAMLDALGALVSHESPSHDKPALDALAATLGARFAALGLTAETLASPDGGDHLRLTLPSSSGLAPALVLCHFDTVWPVGTLPGMPFRVEGDKAYGPGVFDMKASLVVTEFALRALRDLGLQPPRPVVVLLTSDEETGSHTSRALIEREALAADYVLVTEPPLDGDRLKTARKGVARFELEVRGRAAHAGVEPGKGVSAIVELAHQVLALQNLADPEAGTTLNVGVIQGGTTANVVPAFVSAVIDARATTRDGARRLEAAVAALRPVLPGASLTVRGGFNRPPMERTPQVADLYARVRTIGRSLGLDLGEGASGGGSDGNFTAALGRPTVDGFGMPGAGAHAETEHILTGPFPTRAALLATLLMRL